MVSKSVKQFNCVLAIMTATMNMRSEASRTMLIDAAGQRLDQHVNGVDMATRSAYSRGHFQRLFRTTVGETPSECRRRVLLERAAYVLRNGALPVTRIALDAGFDSLEGFSRAFRRAYGVAPFRFRTQAQPSWLLPSSANVHYNPIIGVAVRINVNAAPRTPTGGAMDLTDRLIEHDIWLTRRIFAAAASLSDAQLDAALPGPLQPISFEPVDETLRTILKQLVNGKEAWLGGIHAQHFGDWNDLSVAALRERFERHVPHWLALVRSINAEGRMDEHFVDLGCDPPETFSYGGMIAHDVVAAAQRRGAALQALRSLGMPEIGHGDPIEYDFVDRIDGNAR
jgi:AraC family transcriptional regulator